MNYLVNSFRHFFRSTLFNVACLGVGLAMGLVLASKVCFERTFDDFYADAERIVYVNEAATINGKYSIFARTAGGIAPRMAEYFPEVVSATRFVWGGESDLKIEGSEERVSVEMSFLADSAYTTIFNTEIIAGDIKTALSARGNLAISMSLARKLYRGSAANEKNIAAELIGRKLDLIDTRDSTLFTISAVYEDYPFNASYRPEMLVSLKSILSFMSYDGTDNLVGNDMYMSFAKLQSGVGIEEMNDKIAKFCEDNLPMDELRAQGFDFRIILKPLSQYHEEQSNNRNMLYLLAFIAFALIMTSVLNYLLSIVSASVTRGKEMAVRKCLGAGRREIYGMMMTEAVVHTLFAVLIAVLLILAFRGTIEELSGSELAALFSGRPLLMAVGIVGCVVLVNGILPSELFLRIPVAVAFRSYRENKRAWKMALLSVEFAAVAFLLVSLATISMQYHHITNAKMGFDSDRLAMIHMPEAVDGQKQRLIGEIRKLSVVEDACFAHQNPFQGYSGDNISVPGETGQLFNIQDAYYVDDHYVNVMGLKMRSGREFNPDLQNDEEMIVDASFAEMLRKTAKVDDPIGTSWSVTGHDNFGRGIKIVGVFDDFKTGSFMKPVDGDLDNDRPMAIFYLNPLQTTGWYRYIFVKYKELTAGNMAQVQAVIDDVLKDQRSSHTAFESLMLENYTDTRNMRNTVLIGGIIALLIALAGLIGYTIDEVRHRRKEIAIRRVNGARMAEVRSMFIRSIMRIAVPSVVTGCILAVIAMEKWQQQFTITIGLPWWQAVVCGITALLLIAGITALYVQKYAGKNPADSLRTE